MRNASTMRRSILAAGFCASTAAFAGDYEPCVQHAQLVDSCWTVRGRVGLYNGNPTVRIWPVGSSRILGVRHAEPQLVPPELGARLAWDTNVFADLKVCPLTRQRAGAMQIVCVASARNMTARPR